MADYRDYIQIADADEALQQALLALRQERDGTALGLKSRYSNINKAVGKHFRQGYIYTLFGGSGSGKSYLLELLNMDFSNVPIVLEKSNYSTDAVERLMKRCNFVEDGIFIVKHPINTYKTLNISANLEMKTSRILTRKIALTIKRSVKYLQSSSPSAFAAALGQEAYNKLSDEELRLVEAVGRQFDTTYQIYVDKSTTIENLVRGVLALYEEADKENPGIIPIFSIDHLLLVKGGGSELEITNNVIKCLIELAMYGFIVIPVGQLNGEIEKVERINTKNFELHYPKKGDMYFGGQVYQGSDEVFLLHQPGKLGIKKYGPMQLDTKDLMHLRLIKERDGKEANLWFKNYLHDGEIVQCKVDQVDQTYRLINSDDEA
jgi:energy-coupling factor transporter ATP-binding protein EcfA2